ncbi:hypothetical protein J2TS6_44160 [Paenibacillus albilobatus]|uniref:IrrE N-terminal-like domain-containing protein n=1 Tax=Paenibacillus albilobatus TaxID=2716884 RepID=A0A919XMS2_9BACL|nr:ImmA/IrrE family metallo-endopeptidase [Paenibacillus albilobatus]GIO33275.1 hypothetical protein J2TS6_44160 [Paenibacillus albilobatus]
MKHLISKARIRANDVRSQLGLGDEPISNIFTLIEDQGIYLFFKNLGENVSAMFIRSSNAHMVIINSNKTKGHQIFSAAHELSHFLYDKDLLGGICQVSKTSQDLEVEKLADFFASHFLLPEEGLLKHISKRTDSMERSLSLADVIYLQQYYGVSWQAMINRLYNINCITANEFETFKNVSIKREASRLGYDLSLYEKTYDEKPSQRYVELAMKNYQKFDISETRLNEYLNDVGLSLLEMEAEVIEEGDYA